MGPVFHLEWLSACRRGRHHLFRGVYTAALTVELLFFLVFWAIRAAGWLPAGVSSRGQALAELNWMFLQVLLLQHGLLLILATPALAAGTVSDEKTRGTLGLVLTSSLSSGEIIIGKWLGQAAQVMVLALPALPLITLLLLLTGLGLGPFFAWLLDTCAIAMLLTAAALLASVFARRTTTAVACVYLAVGGCVAARLGGLGAWPLWELDPVAEGPWWTAARRLGVAGSVLLTVAFLALATWQLRGAFARQLAGVKRQKGIWRLLERPAVRDNPLRWKERYVGELGLLAFLLRFPIWLRRGGTALGLFFVLLICLIPVWPWQLASLNTPRLTAIFVMLNAAYLLLAGFVAGARSSGIISGERERHSWDGLLVTPLSARQLVRGKLWGVMDGARAYLVFSLVPLLMLALAAGFWCALTTLCFWFLTWGFVYFQCANGIYWSVRSQGSWQSLLKASSTGLAAVAWRGFLLGIPGVCLVVVLLDVLGLGLLLPWGAFRVGAMAVGFATAVILGLFGRAEELLQQAERYLSVNERAGSESDNDSQRPAVVTGSGATPALSLAFRARAESVRQTPVQHPTFPQ